MLSPLVPTENHPMRQVVLRDVCYSESMRPGFHSERSDVHLDNRIGKQNEISGPGTLTLGRHDVGGPATTEATTGSLPG